MTDLLRAAATGDFLSLEAAVLEPEAFRYRDSVSGWNALHFAVEGGHFECVALLAEELVWLVEERDTGGFSPVDYACAFNDPISLAILLKFAAPSLDVTRGESAVLRTHRDTTTFMVIQNWRRSHGLPVSPLVSKSGTLQGVSDGPASNDVIVPVASHVVLPGETVKSLCFAYATTPRELRFLNPDSDEAHRDLSTQLAPGTILRVPLRVQVRDNTKHITMTSSASGVVVLNEERFTEKRRFNSAVDVGGPNDSADSAWRNQTTTSRVVDEESSSTNTTRKVARANSTTDDTAKENAEERDQQIKAAPKENEKRVVITTTTTTTTVQEDRDEAELNDHARDDDTDGSTTDTSSSAAVSDDEVQATHHDEVADEDRKWHEDVARRQKNRRDRDEAWLRRQTELRQQQRDAEDANDHATLDRLKQQQSEGREEYLAWQKNVEDDDARLTEEHERRRSDCLRQAQERRERREEEARAYEEERNSRNAERNAAMQEEIASARSRADEAEEAALTAELDRLRKEDERDAALRNELRQSQEAEYHRRLADAEKRRKAELERRNRAAERRTEIAKAAADRDDQRFRDQLAKAAEDDAVHAKEVEKRREEEERKALLHERRVQQLDKDRQRMDDAAREMERKEAARSDERQRKRDSELRDALESARQQGDRRRELELEQRQQMLDEADATRRRRQHQEESMRNSRARSLGFGDDDGSDAERRQRLAERKRQAVDEERAALQREHEAAIAADAVARRQALEREREAAELQSQRLEEARRRGDHRREMELLAEQEAAARRRSEADRRDREADAKRQRDFEFAMSAVQRSSQKDDGAEKLLRAEKREVRRMKRRIQEQRRQAETRELHEQEQQRLLAEARERGDRIEADRLKRQLERERREAEEQQRRDEEAEWERQAKFEASMARRRQRQDSTKAADDVSSRKSELSEIADERQWLKNEEAARRRQAARTRQHNDEQIRQQKQTEAEEAARQEREAQRKRLLFAARMSHDEEQEKRLLEEDRLDQELTAKREADLAAENKLRQEALQQDLRRLQLEADLAEEKRKEAESRRKSRKGLDDTNRGTKSRVNKQRVADQVEIRNARLEAEANAIAEQRKADEEAAARRRAEKQKEAAQADEKAAALEEQRRKDLEDRKRKAIEDAQKRIQARRLKEKQERLAQQEKLKQQAEAQAAKKSAAQREEDLSKKLQDMRNKARSESTARSRTPMRSRTAERKMQPRSPASQERLLQASEDGRHMRVLETEREAERQRRLVAVRSEEADLARRRLEEERGAKAETTLLELRRRDEEDALRRAQRRDEQKAKLEWEASQRTQTQQAALAAEERQRQERRLAAEAALQAAKHRRESMLTSPITASPSLSSEASSVRVVEKHLSFEEQRQLQLQLRRRRMEYGGDHRTRALAHTGRLSGIVSGFNWTHCRSWCSSFAPLPLLRALSQIEEPVMASLRGPMTPSHHAPPTMIASPISAPPPQRPSTPPPQSGEVTPGLQSKPSFARRSGSMIRTSSFALPPATHPKASPVPPSRSSTIPGYRPETPRNLFDTPNSSRPLQWAPPSTLHVVLAVGDMAIESHLACIASRVKAILSLLLSADSCTVTLFAGPRSAAALAPHDCSRVNRAGLLSALEVAGSAKGPVLVVVGSDAMVSPTLADGKGDSHLVLTPSEAVAASEMVQVLGASATSEWPRLLLVDAVSASPHVHDFFPFGGEPNSSVVAFGRLHRASVETPTPALLCCDSLLQYVGGLAALHEDQHPPHAGASFGCVRDFLSVAASADSGVGLHLTRGALADSTDLVPLLYPSPAPCATAVVVGWRALVLRSKVEVGPHITTVDHLRRRLRDLTSGDLPLQGWAQVNTGLPVWLDVREAVRGVQWESTVEVLVSPTATFESAALRDLWTRCASTVLGWTADGGKSSEGSTHVLLSTKVVDSRRADGHYDSLRLTAQLLLQRDVFDHDDDIDDDWSLGTRTEGLLQKCLRDVTGLKESLTASFMPPVTISFTIETPYALLPPRDSELPLAQCLQVLRDVSGEVPSCDLA